MEYVIVVMWIMVGIIQLFSMIKKFECRWVSYWICYVNMMLIMILYYFSR